MHAGAWHGHTEPLVTVATSAFATKRQTWCTFPAGSISFHVRV